MDNYKILHENKNFNIPIFIDSKIDDMGVMVDFDNNITEINNIYNFTYIINNYKVKLYITGKYEILINQTITINWGDGETSELEINQINGDLPTIEHTYNFGKYMIKISFITPWNNDEISKIINIPQNIYTPNLLGTLSGITIPYTEINNVKQNYIFDEDKLFTEEITYMVMTNSKINQLKLYGQNKYNGITIENNISGYTIDNISYKDYPDGLTIMEISTVGHTRDEIIKNSITRNEQFIGFVDTPIIYSDVFVQRGKQSITENIFKLCEISNIDSLSNFFNIESN
jgi:hypothetical protein